VDWIYLTQTGTSGRDFCRNIVKKKAGFIRGGFFLAKLSKLALCVLYFNLGYTLGCISRGGSGDDVAAVIYLTKRRAFESIFGEPMTFGRKIALFRISHTPVYGCFYFLEQSHLAKMSLSLLRFMK